MHMENDEAYSMRSLGDAGLLRLTDWHVLTPCCNYDVQNALKWPLSRHVENTEALKDLSSPLRRFATRSTCFTAT